MTAFSPLAAASEGLRMMRREPKAVLYWIAVWAVALVGIGIVIVALNLLGLRSFASIRRSGPLAAIAAPTLLALWVMNVATVYRAVLRPGEHGWHLFKLGRDEARVATVLAMGVILLIVAGGVPMYALFVLFSPLYHVARGLNWYITLAGALSSVALDVWLVVRLSLAPVETFAEGGFPLRTYWSGTRGQFWRLLFTYIILAVEVFIFLMGLGVFGLIVGVATDVALNWQNPNLLQRLFIWLLVPVTALLAAVSQVAFWTLIAACQAYAYRAITLKQASEPAADLAG